jgi:hypothetical protein
MSFNEPNRRASDIYIPLSLLTGAAALLLALWGLYDSFSKNTIAQENRFTKLESRLEETLKKSEDFEARLRDLESIKSK